MPHDRSLLTLLDLPRSEIERLWLGTAGWKVEGSRRRARFADRRVATFFDGPTFRSRLAWDTGIDAVGAHRVDLPLTLGEREPVEDTAATLTDGVDAVVVRTRDHAALAALAQAADVPVINAMTDAAHPVEILSDAYTLLERRGPLENLTVTFVGEATNTLRSWCELTVGFDIHVRQACPTGHGLDEEFLEGLAEHGQRGTVDVTHDLRDAVAGADVLYTDGWPAAARKPGRRRTAFEPFRITVDTLDAAGTDVVLMHATPVNRGDEVSAEAFADPRSITRAAKRNLAPLHAAVVERALGG
ncbi:Rossmann-fold NAD(P)-binding domain-containing protein [Georgenia sp.]